MPEIEEAMSLGGSLVTTEAYGTWYELIEKKPNVMFSKILDRFRSGNSISGAEYVDLWRKLKIVRQKFYDSILPYDFVIMPTAPILPPNMNRLLNDDEYYVSQNLMALRNTRLCNFLGGCALTIPTNVPSNGIMLMGFPNTEEKLLRYGAVIERALQA
jgi:aspartyl-tRNA(Asn)/glutamyl-tRNA(Gln) amidotransferase subunit A